MSDLDYSAVVVEWIGSVSARLVKGDRVTFRL
jgi:hypothetical protein